MTFESVTYSYFAVNDTLHLVVADTERISDLAMSCSTVTIGRNERILLPALPNFLYDRSVGSFDSNTYQA